LIEICRGEERKSGEAKKSQIQVKPDKTSSEKLKIRAKTYFFEEKKKLVKLLIPKLI